MSNDDRTAVGCVELAKSSPDMSGDPNGERRHTTALRANDEARNTQARRNDECLMTNDERTAVGCVELATSSARTCPGTRTASEGTPLPFGQMTKLEIPKLDGMTNV